jgi:hypothetical protein
MERRYLAATIAMAATFALFSHAFGSGLLNRVPDSRATLISEMHCAAQTLRARLLDKVNRSLGAGNANAEEAQLRVELNLPAAPALAAVPAVPAAPPVAPVAPVAPVKAAARQIVACPSQRLVAVQVSKDYQRAQARAMAMQSRALAEQAKMMVVQARLTSQAMQREITRAAMAQVRANLAQAKIDSHPCSGERTVRVTSRSDDDDTDVNVDVDQLSRQIEEQVSRSLRNSVRNF